MTTLQLIKSLIAIVGLPPPTASSRRIRLELASAFGQLLVQGLVHKVGLSVVLDELENASDNHILSIWEPFSASEIAISERSLQAAGIRDDDMIRRLTAWPKI